MYNLAAGAYPVKLIWSFFYFLTRGSGSNSFHYVTVVSEASLIYCIQGLGISIIFKKLRSNLYPSYDFKAACWADWHGYICTSHWENGLSPVYSLDKPCPLPSICVSLMHEAVIFQMHQPPQKGVTGDYRIPRGIKMFLTDWLFHLFPGVSLCCRMWKYW